MASWTSQSTRFRPEGRGSPRAPSSRSAWTSQSTPGILRLGRHHLGQLGLVKVRLGDVGGIAPRHHRSAWTSLPQRLDAHPRQRLAARLRLQRLDAHPQQRLAARLRLQRLDAHLLQRLVAHLRLRRPDARLLQRLDAHLLQRLASRSD